MRLTSALPFSLLFAVASALSLSAATLRIVDGTTRAAIIVSASPSPGEKLAAEEIARYVGRMTGTPLTVTAGNAPITGPAIVLARGPEDALGSEGYSLTLDADCLVIHGVRDRSVLFGAYDLLERLGCRWLAPSFGFYSGDAEIVPQQSRLVLTLDRPVVEKPHLALRKLYVEEGHSHDATNLPQLVDWMTKSRFNTLVIPTDYQGRGRVKWDNWRQALTPELQRRDLDIEVGGHGYQNFLNAEMEDGRIFREHPEWFGMAAGKRVAVPARVFCTSNPAAVDFLTANVVRYLSDRPEITIFDFWPPDGARWCECEACSKLGPPEDRQARLVAQVMATARARGIKARFECIAYAAAINPPHQPAMDASVLIDFCPIAQCFEVPIFEPASDVNARYAAQFQAWRGAFTGDISIYSYYRKYAWRSLPVIIPHYMQRDLQWYERTGAQGISSYSEPGDWRAYELNHYTLARLAWNPAANVDAIVADFATQRFGPRAAAAQELYQAMEDVVRNGCNIPGTKLKSPAELTAFIARLETARTALQQAAGPQNSATAALLTTVDYALRDLSLQKLRAANADSAALNKEVESLVAFYNAHHGEGVFLTREDNRRSLQSAYDTARAAKKKK